MQPRHLDRTLWALRLRCGIPLASASPASKAQAWRPLSGCRSTRGLRSITLDEAVDVTTLVPLPSPSEASPMKLHGDIATCKASSERSR